MMTTQNLDFNARPDGPQPQSLVLAPAQESLIVPIQLQAIHCAEVPAEPVEALHVIEIPEADVAVFPSGQKAACRPICSDATDPAGPFIAFLVLAVQQIPLFQTSIPASSQALVCVPLCALAEHVAGIVSWKLVIATIGFPIVAASNRESRKTAACGGSPTIREQEIQRMDLQIDLQGYLVMPMGCQIPKLFGVIVERSIFTLKA
mmetsp:Transcript_42721/g.91628  ORF Transcript_42721/g.91628 Transcript_42721/m.91628 type:complete len:205 (+) Transcript_42721:923-1537(+)